MKKVEDMAKSLQDKANKYQLNFVAEDTTRLPKSAVVTFSKPAKTNWASYEVLSNFTTEAGKAVADMEASELRSGATGKVVVVSEEKAAEVLKEKVCSKTNGALAGKVEQEKRVHIPNRS